MSYMNDPYLISTIGRAQARGELPAHTLVKEYLARHEREYLHPPLGEYVPTVRGPRKRPVTQTVEFREWCRRFTWQRVWSKEDDWWEYAVSFDGSYVTKERSLSRVRRFIREKFVC